MLIFYKYYRENIRLKRKMEKMYRFLEKITEKMKIMQNWEEISDIEKGGKVVM